MSHYATDPTAKVAPADVRAWLYTLVSPALALIVAFGYLNANTAALIGAVVIAALASSVAFVNTVVFWRKWAYGLIAPVSALAIYLGWATETTVLAFGSLIAVALGFGLAAVKTPTLAY